jgi:hypothetical protein
MSSRKTTRKIGGDIYKRIQGFDNAYWIGISGVYSDKSGQFLEISDYSYFSGSVRLCEKGKGGKSMDVDLLYRKYFGTNRQDDRKKKAKEDNEKMREFSHKWRDEMIMKGVEYNEDRQTLWWIPLNK